MHRAVILLHTQRSVDPHFDWFIDQPSIPIEHRLLAFQCDTRPDSPAQSAFIAYKRPDHRAHYLTYEGPIAGNRGIVRRLVTGEVLHFEHAPNALKLQIRWANQTIQYLANPDPQATDRWIFHIRDEINPLDG